MDFDTVTHFSKLTFAINVVKITLFYIKERWVGLESWDKKR